MREVLDLSSLNWQLAGWTPYMWRLRNAMETGESTQAEVGPVAARVPGSVQLSLLEAGIIPDWNIGLDSRLCEWIENRHWVYSAALPNEWISTDRDYKLLFRGLDYSGWIGVNGVEIGEFHGSFVPYSFDLGPFLRETGNTLHIAFDCPPRWLGACGYTYEVTDWKPRFNYTWDWMVRLVQIGIWDSALLVITSGSHISSLRCFTDLDSDLATGSVWVKVDVVGDNFSCASLEMDIEGKTIHKLEVALEQLREGFTWSGISVRPWWAHGMGEQPTYTLKCRLYDQTGEETDQCSKNIGFKHVRWEQCEEAPEGADPWICVINGKPVFLQGINWTPIRPNFADVSVEDYRDRLEIYRDLGFNIMRVWGGGFLEKECFYDLCDELGLLVWQEFTLCSSGIDNWPPEDQKSIQEQAAIAESYIERRQHHISLTIWCGGNELMGGADGTRVGYNYPVTVKHPLIARLSQIVEQSDPTRRFLPTSPSGPRFKAREEDFGKGLYWDVHGEWAAQGRLGDSWTRYWSKDDALFRSETGAPGASSSELIRRFAGELPAFPASEQNPLWRHPSLGWTEWKQFVSEHDREPLDLEEYVAWSQTRQADALSIAVSACKGRFPKCGGIIIWMGHDSYPCCANTSILDYEGRPKPAALRLKQILLSPAEREEISSL